MHGRGIGDEKARSGMLFKFGKCCLKPSFLSFFNLLLVLFNRALIKSAIRHGIQTSNIEYSQE